MPFFRVVNNTIYGGAGVAPLGIDVARNSAPTLLNNIIANVGTAVTVDGTSTATVLGTTVYQNITNRLMNTGIGLGTFPLRLKPGDPLFVNPGKDNFYLAAGSQAIDSSLNSLPDRAGMVTVETSRDLPQSPISRTTFDALGQLRVDDPSVASPPGEGSNIFKDRGALDRVDFTGPTAQLGLVEPPADATGGSVAPQWVADDTTSPAGQTLATFAIQLLDSGTGIDDSTVIAANIAIYRNDNPTTPLSSGTDYFFTYDTTNHVVYLTAPGVWTGGFTYKIVINNSAASGIKDIAGNTVDAEPARRHHLLHGHPGDRRELQPCPELSRRLAPNRRQPLPGQALAAAATLLCPQPDARHRRRRRLQQHHVEPRRDGV